MKPRRYFCKYKNCSRYFYTIYIQTQYLYILLIIHKFVSKYNKIHVNHIAISWTLVEIKTNANLWNVSPMLNISLRCHMGYLWSPMHIFIYMQIIWMINTETTTWSLWWDSNSNSKQQLGCRFDIMDYESYFFVFWHMQLYMSWYIISFFGFTLLNILHFFKYSCTNIFL